MTDLEAAIIATLNDAAVPMSAYRLQRAVAARLPDATRGKVDKAAAALAREGTAAIYDAATDKYMAPGVEPDDSGDKQKLSAAIVEIVTATHRIGRTSEGRAFIVPEGSHVVTVAGTRRFNDKITHLAWTELGAPAGKAAVEEVASTVTAMGFDTEPVDVWIRVAPLERRGVVIDVGDTTETLVVVDRDGWNVTTETPGPLFMRTDLTAAMPKPVQGGDEKHLWDTIRVDATQRDFMLGWLASAFIPQVPHIILAFVGEQGTAKTETLRAVSLLIDPLTAPVRTLPGDTHELAVTMAGSWFIAFDNVSKITPAISDALCRVVTGDAFLSRSLYSDAEISAVHLHRVTAMDGIDLGVLRGDFLDRTAILELAVIPEHERRTLFSLVDGMIGVRDTFAAIQPGLFGVLLDAVVDMLRGLASTRIDGIPRMADAAVLLAALDTQRGTHAAAQYETIVGQNVILAVESDQVALAVRDFMLKTATRSTYDLVKNSDVGEFSQSNGSYAWTGTASDLLKNTTPRGDMPRGWPTTAHHFSGRLRRAMPGLRMLGIEIDEDRDAKARHLTLTYSPNGETAPADSLEDPI